MREKKKNTITDTWHGHGTIQDTLLVLITAGGVCWNCEVIVSPYL
jgi:hypothetical protein